QKLQACALVYRQAVEHSLRGLMTADQLVNTIAHCATPNENQLRLCQRLRLRRRLKYTAQHQESLPLGIIYVLRKQNWQRLPSQSPIRVRGGSHRVIQIVVNLDNLAIELT